MNRTLWKSALGACLALVAIPGDVLAGRGGGYGGGRGGYGGGGERGGGGYGGGGERGGYGGQAGGSSSSHSPSFSSPPSRSGGSGSQSGGQGGYGNRNGSGGNGGAAAAGAGYANKNQSGSHNAGAAAAGAGYSNKNQSTLPNSGAGAAGAAYSNKNQSTLPNGGAAAGGAAYSNRNQSTLPNNGAAAGGAAYANRNQSTLPNNGAGAAGAAYANRNQSTLPNGGAAAVGAGYANRNNSTLPNGGAGAVGAAAGANYANNNNGYNGLGASAVGAGAWNNNNSGAWASGMGTAGVGAWGTGSPQYGYGYSAYSNPYAGGGGGQAVNAGAPQQGAMPVQPTNYTQPISTTAAAPAPAAADQATSAFAQARDAFKQGNYDQALQLDQQALAQAPNDTTMHQFLALTLFAQGRYEQAAAPLYAVLSVGPGWDWTTLSGMYPDVDTYTAQLRKLETYVRANPNSAHARFVLAYQYLCDGHDENAVAQLRDVVKLQPGDTLSAQLVAQYHPAGAPQPASISTASDATPGVEGKIAGKWMAAPAAGASVALAIGDDGKFSWTASGAGKPASTIAGSSTLADGVLTLTADGGQAGVLAGNVSWQDVDHFTFRLVNGPSGDPGLRFAR